MTSVSSRASEAEDVSAAPKLSWKERTHFNFVAGRSRLRALPVVIHLLPDDLAWFSKDHTLFAELKSLIRDRVIAITDNGDRDADAPKSRKRARKQELCVQGDRLQFTYRYRKTAPRYTVLSYDDGCVEAGETLGSKSGGSSGPHFRHLPLSDSTLLVWVYRFDAEDPYAPVPNAAALHFAPAAKPAPAKALDLEAFGRRANRGSASVSVPMGPRDSGLLAWLWGGSKEGGAMQNSEGKGGVRQHFIGSASWQGKPAMAQGRDGDDDDDDIQRAIALSLAAGSGSRRTDKDAADEDFLEVVEVDGAHGVQESKTVPM